MFTGIVEETGSIELINKTTSTATLKINAEKVLKDTAIGDSIATNGVCLTVTSMFENAFLADVSQETLEKTNLIDVIYSGNPKVNLERALRLSDRLGGHIVTGHVDGTGKIVTWAKKGTYAELGIQLNANMQKYVVPKGSIAINGISLTIAEVEQDIVKLAIIPHSLKHTNLMDFEPGMLVNIECDILGKYVEQLLTSNQKKDIAPTSQLTYERLNQLGF